MDKAGEMAAFVRAVEDGSLSAAGRTLGLSPSAVSKLISRLEERLDARLLHRSTRRQRLTEEGDVYYQHARRIVAEINEAEEAVSHLRAAPRGTLRIYGGVGFMTYQVEPLISEFLRRFPEIRIEMTLTDRWLDLIEEGFDMALPIVIPESANVVVRVLAETQRHVVAAPAYVTRRGTPQTPADLKDHNCLTWTADRRELNDWPFETANGREVITVDGDCAANNGDTLYRLCIDGVGIMRLAEWSVSADICEGRLVHLLTEFPVPADRPIYAVYPHRRHLAPKVRALIDFLVEKFTPVPPWKM